MSGINKIEKLEALYKINESILSILEVGKLIEKTIDILEKTFGFDSCAILFLDEETNELYIRSAVGYSPKVIREFRTTIGGKGITGYVAKKRSPLFISNIHKEPRYITGVEGAKSEISVPLIADDRLIGIIDIESKEEYSFTKDDFNVLCLFASNIALAIHNAITYENERKKVNQLLLLNEIRNRIVLKQNVDELLNVAAVSMVELFSYGKVLIYLWDDVAQQLKVVARAGKEWPEMGPEFEDKLGAQLMGKSFLYDKTLLVKDKKTCALKSGGCSDILSELVVPIHIQKNLVGAIYIASENRYTFDEKNIMILEAVRDQFISVIKDASIFSDFSKRSKQAEVMHKIGRVPIERFDFRKFVDDIIRLIHKTFGFAQVSMFSYEPLSRELELISHAGLPFQALKLGSKVTDKEGLVGYVARSGKRYLCNDVTLDAAYVHENVLTKSSLTVPVSHNNDVLGVLNIESQKINQFDKSDLKIFKRIADQIAYTIVNAELFKQKSKAHSLLLNLNSLSREVNSTFDLEKMIPLVIKKIPEYLNCRLCSIFFYYPETQKMVLMGHNFPDLVKNDQEGSKASDNVLMNRVLELKYSIVVTDIEKELNIRNNPRYQTKSFMNLLLKHPVQDKLIGVLNLTDKLDASHFTSQEFFLVNSFAEHLSVAIENAQQYSKILELSITDGLTGLYVHRYFQETLTREISRSRRYNSSLSLVMLDIDNFKTINDKYGHQVGDIVLREISILIKKELRDLDIAARYGGEEFALILPQTTLEQAKTFAERLQKRIRAHEFIFPRNRLRITASQGISEYDPGISKDDLIKRADQALLKAKTEGKNRIIVAG